MNSTIAADETQPLLAGEPTSGSTSPSPSPTLAGDATALSFKDDPDNPRNWPAAFKWSIVCLLALLAFTVTFTCISVVPFAAHIVEELEGENSHGNVRAASVLLVTIWELGEAAGPLAIAPLSETASWGRSTVLTAATTMFAITTAGAALAPSAGLFIAARGFTGVAVATNVLNPAIVGDLFPPEQRGSAMALVQLAPLLGGAIGPALGGAVADTWGWRSVMWLSTALSVACNVLVWVAFRETFTPAIKRARKLRQRRENQKIASGAVTPTEESIGAVPDVTAETPETPATSSGLRHIRDAVLRPAILLADSFVLAILALYGSVNFSYFYVMSVTLPDILETRYNYSSAATGSAFLIFSLGAFFSVVVCNTYLDPIYLHLTSKYGRVVVDADGNSERVGRPEFKLPLAVFSTLLLPLATAAYGWAAELTLPAPLLFAAEGLIGSSMLLTFIPLAAYVVDAFGLYAASAMTGVIVTRCLCGTFLPLAVSPLVDAFGYGWGFMVMAGICFAVTPIPVFVYYYGESWRQLSKYTHDA